MFVKGRGQILTIALKHQAASQTQNNPSRLFDFMD